ncbi:MAG: hypothetical protein ABIR84_12410 [Candidatus Nitrotoga sp.]
MSVTPKEFLDSATKLAIPGCDEMTQRNVISRSYYAAYHRSCEIINPNAHNDRGGMHKNYFFQLNCGAPGSIERKIGGRLKALYARRIDADYKLDQNLKNDAYILQMQTANDLFKILAEPRDIVINSPPQARPKMKVVK